MLKSCSYCGRIHERNYECSAKPKRIQKITYIDKFRWSKAWKQKRHYIRHERDLSLCRICLLNDEYTTTQLDVHHIIPIKDNFDLRLDDNNLITLCRFHHEQAECGNISRETLRENIPPPISL